MAKKKIQYYKVIDTKHGHHGVFYKVGLNVDPTPMPLNDIGSCQPGALYFVDAEHISRWLGFGDSVAWVTPMSKVKVDGDKFKAHKLKVTKILPIKEALRHIKEITLQDLMGTGVDLTDKEIESFPLEQVAKYYWEMDYDGKLLSLILKNATNKKLIKYLKENIEIDWNKSEVRKLIKANLTFLVSTETVRDLIWDGRYIEAMKVINTDPKKYLAGLLQ